MVEHNVHELEISEGDREQSKRGSRMSNTYRVEIIGKAADEVERGVRSGKSPGAVVSDILVSRRWIRENVEAGRLYIKVGHKFREVLPA